jgi:hypothetical protein
MLKFNLKQFLSGTGAVAANTMTKIADFLNAGTDFSNNYAPHYFSEVIQGLVVTDTGSPGQTVMNGAEFITGRLFESNSALYFFNFTAMTRNKFITIDLERSLQRD